MANDLEYSLGMNTAPFQRAADQTLAAAGTLSKELTKKFELKDLGRTLATALGFNLQSIAQMLVTPLRESAEAAERIERATGRSAEAVDRLIALRQTESQKLETMEKQLKRMNQEMDKPAELSWWRQAAAAVALHFGQAAIAAKLLANESANAAKKAEDIAAIAEKNLQIEQQRMALEKAHAAALAKSRQAEYDFQQKLDADRLDYIDANFERLTLEAKATRGLTEEERTRLDVLRLQAKQLDVQASIRAVLSLEKRTPEEEAALTLLLRQNDTLTAQIAAKQQLTAVTNDQAAAEEKVGEALGFALGKLKSYVAEWTGFKGTIDTIGRGNSDLSDRELQRKLQNIRSDIGARTVRETGRGALVGIGGTADLMLEGQRAQLQQLQNELRLRDEVRRAADAYGEERAFRMFNLSEQRFADILRGTTEQQRILRSADEGIRELNNRLKAGIPVINLSQPGGG